MNHESRPKAAPADLGDEVETNATATGGHGADVLTAKQRKRYSPVTIDGILAVPTFTSKAFDLVMALGKAMRSDGTFEPLRHGNDVLAVEIRPSHRDKAIPLLQISARMWRRYIAAWEATRMAHRCTDLRRGCILLFLQPEAACPACGTVLPEKRNHRDHMSGTPMTVHAEPTRPRNVLKVGDATRDEEGDASVSRLRDVRGVQDRSQEGPSEIAAFAALKRADIQIGEPLSDSEVRALGYRPTSRGWVPIEEAAGA